MLPVLIHGDAAFAGQGVVMETLQLSQARAFYTGGTVHLIINNQVGFTTSDPRDARSTMYCSDVAKMLEAPIFHVNADDPEAVVFVARLALAYRMKFRKDVVIDLVCYRRLGHNEADEPAATQPVMYAKIRQHPTARQIYADKLVGEGVISDGRRCGLDGAVSRRPRRGQVAGARVARPDRQPVHGRLDQVPAQRLGRAGGDRPSMPQRLARLGARIVDVPAGLHAASARGGQSTPIARKMLAGELPLDWGCAETLAYATLLDDGYPIRLTGQDSGRGTFFHRHAVLHDQKTGET